MLLGRKGNITKPSALAVPENHQGHSVLASCPRSWKKSRHGQGISASPSGETFKVPPRHAGGQATIASMLTPATPFLEQVPQPRDKSLSGKLCPDGFSDAKVLASTNTGPNSLVEAVPRS